MIRYTTVLHFVEDVSQFETCLSMAFVPQGIGSMWFMECAVKYRIEKVSLQIEVPCQPFPRV